MKDQSCISAPSRNWMLIAMLLACILTPAVSAQAQFGGAASALCSASDRFATRVSFADRDRAQKTLEHRDTWARQLSDFDLGARQRTVEPTSLKKFLDFAGTAGRDWSSPETANWTALIAKLSDAMQGLHVRVPNIDLVKSSGAEEFDAAYTRTNAVTFPESVINLPAIDSRSAYFLLAHEVFHVLSRTDPRLRDDLYALLGFTRVDGFGYPAELEDRRLSNPDAFEYLHTLTVQSGAETADVMPLIQSLLPLNEIIQLPNIFGALDIVLLSVDASTGEPLRDGNGQLITYNFDNTNWVPLLLRNSPYIIHPEEILADNFATLMEWRSEGVLPPFNPGGFPANDVDLLVAIERRLTGRCEQP